MTTGQRSPIISYSHYYYSDNLQSPMAPTNYIHSKWKSSSIQTANINVPGDRDMVGGLKHFSPTRQHVFHQIKYIWKVQCFYKVQCFTHSLYTIKVYYADCISVYSRWTFTFLYSCILFLDFYFFGNKMKINVTDLLETFLSPYNFILSPYNSMQCLLLA